MLRIVFFVCCALFNEFTYAQNWSAEQKKAANTTQDINALTETEKEAIIYINLARLYPQDFIKNELDGYYGPKQVPVYYKNSEYRESLIKELKNRKSGGALKFDEKLYEFAKCFSKELGDAGSVTHERKKCAKGNFAECLSFGMQTGKDIAMQLLIDDKVPSLIHRTICLGPDFSSVGISFYDHKTWKFCTVIDMN